jgi:hypothetical protein
MNLRVAAFAVLLLTATQAHADIVLTDVWINEFHYDNAGADTGEFVEIVAPNTYDPIASGLILELYNGNGGAVYDTFAVASTPALVGGFTFYVVQTTGLQNGAPDGIALSDSSGLYQFLSYEGSFVAVGGAFDGRTSTDVGVSEPNNTPVGQSLQLTGVGNNYSDFTWIGPDAETPDALNVGQSFSSTAVPEPSSLMLLGVSLAFGVATSRRRRA